MNMRRPGSGSSTAFLGTFLGKDIESVNLTDGASATDGSIVDKLDKPEVLTFVT